jgi:hypothetical protein
MRLRRVGVLMSLTENDPEGQARIAAFLQGMGQIGWTDGRNLQIDTRCGAGDPERLRKYAAELVVPVVNQIRTYWWCNPNLRRSSQPVVRLR